MTDIKNISLPELSDYIETIGQRPFRAVQISQWIYQKGALDFDEMTDLPVSLREKLKEKFSFEELQLVRKHTSQDKTTKFLFVLGDGEEIETVVIPASGRVTVCVSTQAGCKFGCRFCASGLGGFKRHLTVAEILGQILYVKNHSKARSVTHIVFMGIGEPLDNYEHVLKAVRTINAPQGMNIAARRITISTCGLVPQIKKLAQEGIQVELAISLHGSNNKIRNALTPINKKYPLDQLIKTCKEYIQTTNRQITFEYILIKDLTCTTKAAEELGALLKGMLCKLNLITYNPVFEFDFSPPSKNEVLAFKQKLAEEGVHSTIRASRGQDVNAACGQLRHLVKEPHSAKG